MAISIAVSGKGGTGKTRLLIEHGLRMEARGWVAGFMDTEEFAADKESLKSVGVSVLIVVDYAETRIGPVRELLRRCSRATRRSHCSGPRRR